MSVPMSRREIYATKGFDGQDYALLDRLWTREIRHRRKQEREESLA